MIYKCSVCDNNIILDDLPEEQHSHNILGNKMSLLIDDKGSTLKDYCYYYYDMKSYHVFCSIKCLRKYLQSTNKNNENTSTDSNN
jgi:hypothetical protein